MKSGYFEIRLFFYARSFPWAVSSAALKRPNLANLALLALDTIASDCRMNWVDFINHVKYEENQS